MFTSAGVMVFIGAYLLGSLSFAVIVSRWMGMEDPRGYGSGNPGATNVLRTGNRKAAALTLAGDAIKGWLAVFLAQCIARQLGLGHEVIAGAALAVTLGHMWPVFFGFKGGKGVATAAGILLALDWRLGLGLLAIWLVLAKGFKISSLAALLAALAAPILTWYLLPQPVYLYVVIIIAVLLIARHHQNIRGLFAGKESKIGGKAESQ
ncbi:glycerol-3-phosphate 1-O-acyltransferase PlsY [Andreprevotia sp. IGB-42]|uniref:glycerol-3-phosphate 1-O-acyltransferase PlsY n=1 Tax=Andreprevotia sp. IGB-42 TaxID=2497473 RepID=UPI0035B53ABC